REVEARRLAVCLKIPPPELEKKWQHALADFDRIVQASKEHGVPVAFVLIPDEFQVNADVLDDAMRAAPLDPSLLDLDFPQRRLTAFFAAREVQCLDLMPAFHSVSDTYALRDTHWNACGNHLAAEQISKWLKTSPLSPGSLIPHGKACETHDE